MARQGYERRLDYLRTQRMTMRPRRRSRFGLLAFLVLCVVLVLGAGTAISAVVGSLGHTSSTTTASAAAKTGIVTLVVQPGDTFSVVSKRMQSAGLVFSSSLFYWYARLNSFGGNLQAGTYMLPRSDSWDQLIRDFQKVTNPDGSGVGLLTVRTVRVTIPEGLRIEEIAQILANRHVASYADLVQQARHGDFTAQFSFLKGRPAGASLEGYLFPNTYDFVVDGGARRAWERMLNQFSTVVTATTQAAFTKEGLTLYQGVMLASIVQREGKIPSDLPLIASVFMNRYHFLNQETHFFNVDATVRYGLGYDAKTHSWWGPVDKTSYAIATPYNTYGPPYPGHPGFPFGPICNAGVLAMQAAAHPAQTDYQYYVARADGSSAFASTYSQFLQVEAANGYATQ